MRKDEKIMKFIQEECIIQDISLKDFTDKIASSMLRRGDDPGNMADKSNLSRWMNGQKTPEPPNYPYIADALSITEDELRCGHRFTDEMIISPEEAEVQAQRKKEMDAILNLIRMNKYFNLIFSAILFSLGIFILNNSLWHNPFIAIATLVMFLFVMSYDNRQAPDRRSKPKEKLTLLSIFRSFVVDISSFIKICKLPSLIGSICSVCFWIIVFVGFIPVIESVLYDGKMYISSGLYLTLSLFFLLRSRRKEN